MQFSGILFDLDGTLIDTIPDLAGAANAMRLDMGMTPISQDILATYVGKGMEQLVIRSLGHEGQPAEMDLVMRGLARYTDHYRKLNGKRSHLYPGVLAGLQDFQAQGMRLAVVTNKSTEFALPLLRQQGLADFFDVIVCGDTCPRKKPDPMPLFHACSLLDIQPTQALFIGDSINDALAARSAGIRMLALPYGYNEGNPVQSLPVDAIVGSIIEAARWAAERSSHTEHA
ncbi:MAG: phosphoglycolate phosphatase [Castellaniella sp.]|uniref:phosphoglycolate phosphatase n=1 Tax=Castellaniella sp. TaxID=1955812 RepID=UPI0012204A2F|nr:phosphoglycolate phosphatase [Castellaniella sp.]TAN27335.1 MAG: phosphoglycolate phosphatase [Castellaniella sp.]